MFLGESFLPQELKILYTKNVPTDQSYLEGLSTRKTGFLFFFFFLWPYNHSTIFTSLISLMNNTLFHLTNRRVLLLGTVLSSEQEISELLSQTKIFL